MIGQTISHYPALCPKDSLRRDSASKRDSRKRNKILEKLGEARPNDLIKRGRGNHGR